MDRLEDRGRAVVEHDEMAPAAEICWNFGQHGLDAVDDGDRVGVGLALHREDERPACRHTSSRLVVLDRMDHRATSPRRTGLPLRTATMISRKASALMSWVLASMVRFWALPCDRADRRVGVGRRDRELDLVDADAARGQRVRVELDAHSEFLAAEDLHLADAVDRRERRRDHRLRRNRRASTGACESLCRASSRTGASAGLTLR